MLLPSTLALAQRPPPRKPESGRHKAPDSPPPEPLQGRTVKLYFLTGGTPVQMPCTSLAAMPMPSVSVGVGVDGFADVHRIGAHLNGQGDLADHVVGVGAIEAAARNLAVAPASMHGRLLIQPRGCRRTATWCSLRRGHWQWHGRKPPSGRGLS